MINLTDILLESKRRLQEFNWPYEKAYLVGGIVRDFFLGNIANDADLKELDMDFCLQFKNAAEKQLFTCRCNRFFSFSTNNSGFNLPRKEFLVETDKHSINHIYTVASHIEIDAFRRDFTINSIYLNIDTEEIIDIFNGIEHCKNRQLEAISSESFFIDPTRFLRMCRFSVQCNLKLPSEDKIRYFLQTISYWSQFELSSYIQFRIKKELQLLKKFSLSTSLQQLLKEFLYSIQGNSKTIC